jgi:adenylate cyclase
MSTERYRVGEFTFDASLACLRRGDTDIALRPKSFALLHHLITHAGRLVTKDELIAEIWPKVIVTEDSLTRCISEVRAALGDVTQKIIKTVPKRGYVFALPVTKLEDNPATKAPVQAIRSEINNLQRRRRTIYFAALFGMLLLVAAMAYVAMRSRHAIVSPRLSLIVLPFVNLNGDSAQDYLGDVLTNELTSALSHLRGATVISADSAFTLKGKHVDTKQLGTDLRVRYALEGSVLPSGGSVRINARLVDMQTATTLWSDRFDVVRADLLRTQDDIVIRLASALRVELVKAEVRRPTTAGALSLDAEDLAMQCEGSSYRFGGEARTPSYTLCERRSASTQAMSVLWSSSRPTTARACRAFRPPTGTVI